MKSRLVRLAVVLVLLAAVITLSRYAAARPKFEKHKESIPLDSQLDSVLKKKPEYREAIEVVQDFYWNAWISEAAVRNGGWKNILQLCTDEFRQAVEKSREIQDAISLGSIHDKVLRIYLDKERSKILGISENEKDKNKIAVLVDLWLGVDQKIAGDYFLHLQNSIELVRQDGRWLISNVYVIGAEEKPANVIPE